MATKQDKSELAAARTAYRKAAEAFQNLRQGSAENPLRAPGERNERLDAAELKMVEAEIVLKHAEAAAATDDPEVRALALWLASALERCKPGLESCKPAAPAALASFDPAALTAHAAALTAYNAKLPDVQKAVAGAVARVRDVWNTALAGQSLLQAARKAAGAAAPRLLLTTEGLPGRRSAGGGSYRAGLAVPYTPDAIDDVCAELRDSVVTADTSALENKRDHLARLIEDRALDEAVEARLSKMTREEIAWESNYGSGTSGVPL